MVRRWNALLLGALLVPGVVAAQEEGEQPPPPAEQPQQEEAKAGEHDADACEDDACEAAACDDATKQQAFDDDAIGDAVHRAIARDLGAEAAEEIQVIVDDGAAVLTGAVNSLLVERRVIELAELTRGVRAVEEHLAVNPDDEVDDGELVARARAALAMDAITADDTYELQAADGVVTLGGTVDSYAEKCIAFETVASLAGVRAVTDELRVAGEGEGAARQGDQVRQGIERWLQRSAQLPGAAGISVASTPEGGVRLEGTVPSARARTLAIESALMLGAKHVDASGLEVDPAATWRGPGEGAAARADQPNQPVAPGAEDRTLPAGAPRASSDDQALQATFEQLLEVDPRLAAGEVNARIESGRVTLEGTVGDLAGKRCAEELAWSLAGVRAVENELLVSPTQRVEDDELKDAIEDAFARHALLSGSGIDVDVDGGRVTLSGDVRSAWERETAAKLASRARGATDLQNDIDVEADAGALVDDEELKERIERQLFWSPFVSAGEVTVTVENGVATLSGQVDSWSEVQAATENALQGGARRVINDLKVREKDE
jgi:osmotically-inducible protein OsmY